MKLDIARADSAARAFWQLGETTWAEVRSWVEDPRTDGHKDGPAYVLGKLSSTRRNRDTVVHRDVVALDADHLDSAGQADLLARLSQLGAEAVVYSTYSHTTEAPRLRILVLPDRTLSPDDYWTVSNSLMHYLGWDRFDHTSAQAERLMYMPSVAPGGLYFSTTVEGRPLDTDAMLGAAEMLYDVPPRDRNAVEVPGPITQPRTVPEVVISDQVRSALRGLDGLRELGDGERMPWPGMPLGLGWDLGVLLMAERLIQAANSGGTYTYDQAHEDFLAHAPANHNSYDRDYKWSEAVKHVQSQPIPYMPVSSSPADEFTQITNALVLTPGAALELQRLRDRDAAQEAYRREKAPAAAPRDSGFLRDVLKRPETPEMRIEGIVPWEASTLLVAKRKIGKTTLNLNMARCLLTGEAFLGRFAVRPVEGIIGMLNYEVSGITLARWADEHSVDPDRFYLVNLRGMRNPLSHAGDRAELAAELREHGVETLMVDPFGRAFTGTSQNDAGEVGAFLTDLDAFARAEVGALDLFLTTHAGWDGERTRGSSALEDWPDSIITMTVGEKEPDVRYLSAIGRDVDLPEDKLKYDAETRTLTLAGVGSRKKAVAQGDIEDLKASIVAALRDSTDGLTGVGLVTAIGVRDGSVAVARDELVELGLIDKMPRAGKGGGFTYRVSE